jgi:hypothetical protein
VSEETARNQELDAKRAAMYAQLCSSYHQIDDFRSKLLAALPIASAGGLFLLLSDKLGDAEKIKAAKPLLVPIGIFGTVVTFALFCYEVYGIRKCGALIDTGQRLEKALNVEGQFITRPNDFINEPFAAGVIYPAVLAAWMFLALYASHVARAALMGSVVFVIGFAAMLIWDIQMVMSARKAAAARTGTLTSDQG